jgi:hypothetical protein
MLDKALKRVVPLEKVNSYHQSETMKKHELGVLAHH